MHNDKAKYVLIADFIAQKIRNGVLMAGDKVPSENALISEFGVSNTTARKALGQLEQTGLVSRVKGKGTIVLNSGSFITRAIGSFEAIRSSFSENLRRDGFEPHVKIIEKKLFSGKVNVEIGKSFHEIVGKIYKIRVLRYAGKVLLKDETRFIDANICKGIDSYGDLDPILITLDSEFGAKVENVERSFSAIISSDVKENFFGKKKQIPLICLEGASFIEGGKIIEIEKSFYRGDKYKFSVESRA